MSGDALNGEDLVDGQVIDLFGSFDDQRTKYPVLPGVIEFGVFFYDAPVYLVGPDGLSIDVIFIDGISRKEEKAYDKKEDLFSAVFFQYLFHMNRTFAKLGHLV